MSESSTYVSPFVRVARDSGPPLTVSGAVDDEANSGLVDPDDCAGDDDHDFDAEPDVTRARPTGGREGLPPSYRMRAEPHYVEALVDRALSDFGPPSAAAAPLPPLETPPAPAVPLVGASAQTAAAPSLAATAAALADAFEAVQAALRDVPLRGRPLRDRVAIELARAEATRGRWLAEAAAVLQIDPLPALDDVDLLQVLAGVFDAFGPENRLSGGAAALGLPTGTCRVFGDERLLATALGAMVAATRALIEERGDARKVSVALGERTETAMRTLEVHQRAVRLPAVAYARAFDVEWLEHPAGPTGVTLLAAARKIAQAHGGTLDIFPLEDGGCRFVLGLPAAD